ncbi:MAG: bifunctional hydroxymethylpyrimidine kinase/phosphomethylpyrimidine kinase [Geobacter sp.]|nr:bifunctional hydroxymethylpyrimidine kinase/phosphomethylpyrimidine kinase [Geobacter sp.]
MDSKPHLMRLVVNREPSRFAIQGLYLITDHGDHLKEKVEAALSGGVTVLQYRNKHKNYDAKFAEGLEIKQLCEAYGAAFIVNDDLRLAKELDADGVHLGQNDGSVTEARRLLGPDKLIGVSTHNQAEAMQAETEGANYIGFGSMYPTASKEIVHLPGPEALAALRDRISIPIVAIGGITHGNACRVIDAGADAIAVISSIMDAPDPALAAAELLVLFNRRKDMPRGAVLTVAGSDSGGGAGIQGDIKTITLLGSYGASVITALTAQNTRGVTGIHSLPPSFVAEQLDAVLSDIPVDVVKTGMLHSAQITETLADKLREYRKRLVVTDPVMVAKGGTSLSDGDAVQAFIEHMLPLSYLVTPNIPEAERLTGLTITDESGMREAARSLHKWGAKNVLLKGGHLPGRESVDILFDGLRFTRFPAERVFTSFTHGTGCTYASAIATFLAQGIPLPAAIAKAKEFITSAIRLSRPLGKGHGPVNHFLASREMEIS